MDLACPGFARDFPVVGWVKRLQATLYKRGKVLPKLVGGVGKFSSTRAERVVVGSAYSCLLQQIIRFPPFPPNILGYLFFTYIN